MTRKNFAILFAAVLFALPGQAAQMTLSDLKDICSGSDEGSMMACKLYILGVTEGASIGVELGKDKTHLCVPEGVSSTDMVLIVKKAMTADLAAFPKDKDMPSSERTTLGVVTTSPPSSP